MALRRFPLTPTLSPGRGRSIVRVLSEAAIDGRGGLARESARKGMDRKTGLTPPGGGRFFNFCSIHGGDRNRGGWTQDVPYLKYFNFFLGQILTADGADFRGWRGETVISGQ